MDFNIKKQIIPYGVLAVLVLLAFYAIYFTKMFLQKKRGIKTNQIGSVKERKIHIIETLMATATYTVVAAELFSVGTGWNYMPHGVRTAGAVLGFIGDAVFFLAVFCMRDSWRAGIPEKDKTDLVTRGIYMVSRNPAFLGFDLMYIGVFLMYGNPVSGAFSVFAIVMLHLQILQEEKFMERTFGEEYLRYKERVCRYLGRKPARRAVRKTESNHEENRR